MDYNPSMTNSSRHSTLLSAQYSLHVPGASKKQAFPSPGLFVLRPFCPTAFLSTGLLVLDNNEPGSLLLVLNARRGAPSQFRKDVQYREN